jgi:hypothetical protein
MGLISYLSHSIYRALAQLMGQVIALDEADAVLALKQKNKSVCYPG